MSGIGVVGHPISRLELRRIITSFRWDQAVPEREYGYLERVQISTLARGVPSRVCQTTVSIICRPSRDRRGNSQRRPNSVPWGCAGIVKMVSSETNSAARLYSSRSAHDLQSAFERLKTGYQTTTSSGRLRLFVTAVIAYASGRVISGQGSESKDGPKPLKRKVD